MEPTPISNEANYRDLSRVSYLIAGRSDTARQLVAQALRNFSATDIRETRNFGLALRLIRRRKPDLIFLGLLPSSTEAADFMNALRRSSDVLPWRVPVVVFSDGACAETAVVAAGMHAEGHMTIPFSVETVEAHILSALRPQPRSHRR